MPDKKLIIDEDWKSHVQAEKEAAAKNPRRTRFSGREQATKPQTAGPHDPGDMPMPPASLELLITTLATETLVALGQVPHPATGQAHVHRNQAQYLIDMIDVLRQKTKGNLTPDEQQMIDSVLHQLRLVFLETAAAGASAAAP